MIRRLAAVFLFLHGVAHAVGFVAAFQLDNYSVHPLSTTLFWERITISVPVTQAMGVGWLLLTVGFIVAAVMTWRADPDAIMTVGVVTIVSLGFCLLASPAALIGLVLDAAILAVLAVHLTVRRSSSARRPASRTGPSVPSR